MSYSTLICKELCHYNYYWAVYQYPDVRVDTVLDLRGCYIMIVFVCTGISIILNMTALFKLSKYDLRNKTNAMLLYQWMNELEMEQSRHSAQQLVQLLKTPDKTTHWALRRTHPNMTHHSFTLILLSGGVTASLLRWGTTQTLSSTSRQSAKHFKLQKNCKTDHFFITFPPPPPWSS